MPKGRRKGKRITVAASESDEEFDINDNESIVSNQSDSKSNGTAEGLLDDVEDLSIQESFEDRLIENIDGATQKNQKGRLECLIRITDSLRRKYINFFLVERKETISDVFEKCLKRGKGQEQSLAAICSSILAIQLGNTYDVEKLYMDRYKTLLIQIMLDNSADLSSRANCASALGIWAMISVYDNVFEIKSTMEALEKVFKLSFFKGDGSAPTHVPEVTHLHTCALMSWGLLLSISEDVEVAKSVFIRIKQLLSSTDVALRMMAGETIALIHEVIWNNNERFLFPHYNDLCDILHNLATDGAKKRTKKDRRLQRSTFRDVYKYIKEGDVLEEQIKFGSESVLLQTWLEKRKYDFFCLILKSGINTHLSENPLLRESFELGLVKVLNGSEKDSKSKIQKTLQNQAISKLRTQARGKHRDKRSDSALTFE